MGDFKRVYSFCETPPGVIKAVDCGIGIPDNNEYSYFNSQLLTEDCFTICFKSTVNFTVIEPIPAKVFLVNNLASSSPGSTISSSGTKLQFIDTVAAGSYRFHVQFTISNISGALLRPDFTFTLGTPAAAPYINAGNGFLQVATEFMPLTVQSEGSRRYLCVIHGVVDLPANSSTAILAKPSTLTPEAEYDFGTFNVEVTKIV